MTNDELERPAMSDLVRFDVGISGGLITSAEGKWVSYASHCASRDALVNVVDAQANEIERLRQRLAEHELDAIRYRWLRSEQANTDPAYYQFWLSFSAKLCREARMDELIDSTMWPNL